MILLALVAGCGPLVVDWPGGEPCDDLTAYPLALAWEDASLAEATSASAEVGHTCEAAARVALAVEGGPAAGAFSVSEAWVWVEPGEAVAVEVLFSPDGYADAAGALVLDAGGRPLALPLLGRVDPDQDGDGHRAVAAGGLDCDDLDAGVHPGATEYRNAQDDDCDGLADEGWIAPGDLEVTEVWPWEAPWVEVHNSTDLPLELAGWRLEVAQGSWVVEGSHPVGTGGYALLEPPLALEPAGEDLVLWLGDEALAGVGWDGAWPVAEGASLALDPERARWPGDPTSWCAASPTPGVANALCPREDEDGDGYAVADGDCDDADPDVHPDAAEVWDWVDRDCNGTVDDAVVGEAAAGWVDAGAAEFFYDHWLHPADTDGDGTELLLPVDEEAVGTWILALEGAAVDGVDAGYASLSEIRLSAEITLGLGPSTDVDGDGRDELVVRSWYGVRGIDGADLGAEATLDDATLEVEAESWGIVGAGLGADLDGDGEGELVVIAWDGHQSEALVFPWAEGSLELTDADLALPTGSAVQLGGDYVPLWADLTGDGTDDLVLSQYASSGAWQLLVVEGGATLADAGDLGDATHAAVACCTGTRQPVVADLDGDGAPDLAVSSPAPSAAEVIAFLDVAALGGTVLPADADVTLAGDTDPWFGSSLAAGDMDGDGAAELVVGSTHDYGLGFHAGTVHAFCGDALADGTLADACRSLQESGESHDAWAMGTAVSAEDFDGDGFADLATVAQHAGDGGRMWFLLSGSGP